MEVRQMASIRIVNKAATSKPRRIYMTANEVVEVGAQAPVRTRDLEARLHLSKSEMKYIEPISQVVRLWGRTDMPSRDQKNKILQNLRLVLGNERVGKILDRIERLEKQK
jgi:hypothetical protein